ncbi:hypothetical protein GY45DRAFT_1438713 [Cubamyces sp. BRFM 1775]|nr:hypothetical protein GY45DRAFT_1438713 [Cubamyces sp. BRFM 1775]
MSACEEFLPSGISSGELEEDEEGLLAETLYLPSDFTAEERATYSLDKLADYELKIRVGLAFDQLEDVRMGVKYRAAHLEHKKKSVRTSKGNQLAEKEIQKADIRVRLLASKYNDNVAKIWTLQPPNTVKNSSPSTRLQRIDLDVDLAIANLVAPRSLGDSKKSGSWIWSVFERPSTQRTRTGKTAESESSVDSAQWYRAKAGKDRADEEVNIRCADFRRTCAGYKTYAEMWRQAAMVQSGGERAYALKTASMWDRMARQCAQEYENARKPGVDADTLDQTRSIRPYLAQMLEGANLTAFDVVLKELEKHDG